MAMSLIDTVRTRSALPTPALRRAIREAAGVSQGQIARELGVHRMTVCRWEAGTSTPSGDHLHAYATILTDLSEATRGGVR
jgi:DNA-binding transcriptional regulator YiaG